MTHPTDEELDAAIAGLRLMLDQYSGKNAWEGYPRYLRDGIDAIGALRAQLADQKRFKDRIIAEASDAIDAIGKRCDDANARADRAEAALAAQIEADADLCNVSCNYGGLAKSPAHFLTMAEYTTYRKACRDYSTAIRNQPHDRTALDRHDAAKRAISEAERIAIRNKALRDAADEMEDERAKQAILAMIDKEGA